MGGNCRDCKTMEEEIYWKCFKTVQFSHILTGHFHHQLEVPKRFVKNLREKLGKEVSLKAPSGAIWKVVLEMERDSLYFKLGWKKFSEDNSLEENDILIFKYNGSSMFDVFMFDGKSLCEKEASYFVTACTHNDIERESRRREKETSGNISDNVLHVRQFTQNQVARQVEEHLHVESASEDDNSMEWIASNKSTKADSAGRCATAYIRKIRRTAEVRRRSIECISYRRPVPEEEKANAEHRANAEASDESLVIVMKEYHVYRGFLLTLPAWWSNNYLPPTHLVLKLQLEGNGWLVKFGKKSTGGMLASGWKKFVLDNSLEKDDVCLFNVVSAESSPIVIDVKIFRVVEEVVPPTPLYPPSSGQSWRPLSSSQRRRASGRKQY